MTVNVPQLKLASTSNAKTLAKMLVALEPIAKLSIMEPFALVPMGTPVIL